MRALALGIIILACLACASHANMMLVVPARAPASPPATARITALSLSKSSFVGGAANATVVGTIVATTSDSSTPTLTLTGTQTGSGNDASSFAISGTTLQTNTAGGTDQPGQYNICIVASGAYSNSPQQVCPTIQATGPGGAGWQLTFSDEFNDPNGMLERLSTVPASAYSWSSGFCSGFASPSAQGCGTLTVASLPTGISSANCTGNFLGSCDVSIIGATNSGAAGNTAVNGLFLVAGVSGAGPFTISLYMPYTGIGTVGLGSGVTVGSGPWMVAIINNSPTWPSGTTGGGPIIASNDNGGQSQFWDPHACSVSGGILSYSLTNSGTKYRNASGATVANYVPPSTMQVSGNGGTITACTVQSWSGAQHGLSAVQGEEAYIDIYRQFPTSGDASNMILNNSNNWPPEIDMPECFGGSSPTAACADNEFSPTVGEFSNGSPLPGAALVQFGVDVSASTMTWFQNGSQTNTTTNNTPGSSWYPVIQLECDNAGPCTSFPSTDQTQYVRLYHKVASNACYATIPTAAGGTVPHVGTCAAPTIASVAFYASCGTGSAYTVGNAAPVTDNSTAGTQISQTCVTMSDGSTFNGTYSITSQTAASLVQLSGANAQVNVVNPGEDGAQSAVIRATPGAGEGGSFLEATLNMSVAPFDPTIGILPAVSDGYSNWKTAGFAALPLIASIATNGTMTVTYSPSAALGVGQVIGWTGGSTTITAAKNDPSSNALTGTGGAGTYTVSPAPGVAVTSQAMTANGIPNRCATNNASCVAATLSPLGGTNDDSSQIQTALRNCTASTPGKVVLLTAGVFRTTGIDWNTDGGKSCTLRGAGPGQQLNTGLNQVLGGGTVRSCTTGSLVTFAAGASVSAGSYCTDAAATQLINTSYNTNPSSGILTVQPADRSWVTSYNLASDAVLGANSITLSTTPSGIAAGDIVWLDEDGSTNPLIGWGFAGSISSTGYGGRLATRWTTDMIGVQSVAGNTVTFDSPIPYAYHTAYAAQLTTVQSSNMMRGIGVENLFMWGGRGGNTNMDWCAYCWYKNIESTWETGDGIEIQHGYHNILRDSFTHESPTPVDGGGGYLMSVQGGTANSLIENNISWLDDKVNVVRTAGGGNVFSYNAMDDTGDMVNSGGFTGTEAAINAGHLTMPHMELLEGNYSPNFKGDSYWGGSLYITVFRNWLTALRASSPGNPTPSVWASKPPLGGGTVFPGTTCTYGDWSADRGAIDVQMRSYYGSYVGNVLGINGQTPLGAGGCMGAQGAFIQSITNATQWATNRPFMFRCGVESLTGNPNWQFDPTCINTVTYTGNWDWVTGQEHCWAYGTTTDQSCVTIPSSFYLSSKPAFFGSTDTWPWVNPTTGTTYILPAKYCFEQNKMPNCRQGT